MYHPAIEFVRQLLEMNHIPVHFVTLPCADFDWMDLGLRSTILTTDASDTKFGNRWLDSLKLHTIHHLTDEFQCNYTAFRLPDCDTFLFCGPILFEEIRSSRFVQLCERLHIASELSDYLRNYYNQISFMPAQNFYLSIFSIIGNLLFGKDSYEVVYTSVNDISEWYKTYDLFFRIPNEPFANIQLIEDRYNVENALLTAVSNGNEAKSLEYFVKLSGLLMPQRLANELRDQKDYVITLNSILRKCVEQIGVHPIHIDNISNRHIQLIEQLSSMEQCTSFSRKIIRDYCQLAREHNLKNYSLLTQKIITYVDTDLCADLSLKSFSERLAVNASYLSTTFKKETGVALTDFVNRRRIQHAQKLLIGTDLPIKSVALQSGISDIYYFSRLFKRITGTTPKAYRNNTTSLEQYRQMSSKHTESPDS